MKNGGYIIVDLTSKIYMAQLALALESSAPVLVYDNSGKGNFMTITKESNTYILKGVDKQIEIASNSTITIYDGVLLENIKDNAGNNRFIEGGLTLAEIAGVTFNYARYSLSGTHLMIVLAGTIANESILANNVPWATWAYPAWIKNKIYPITQSNVIEYKGTTIREIGGSGTKTNTFYLNKGDVMAIYRTGDTNAFTYDAYFRIQFDLLIDND